RERFVPTRLVLRKLMDRVADATSLKDVYDGALASLRETLDLTRAAVLVFDQDNTMRFVASSGLSETYRAAVEGHSPWSPDDTSPQPVLVSDVRHSPDFASFVPLFEQERIAAVAFIPLR